MPHYHFNRQGFLTIHLGHQHECNRCIRALYCVSVVLNAFVNRDSVLHVEIYTLRIDDKQNHLLLYIREKLSKLYIDLLTCTCQSLI